LEVNKLGIQLAKGNYGRRCYYARNEFLGVVLAAQPQAVVKRVPTNDQQINQRRTCRRLAQEQVLSLADIENVKMLSRMALAAMDSEPVELPLDYLQGHKDGLEAAQLAEANHPETGDWLYDDPIELAKAIRKGPDMPPAQPVADSEPVIVVGDDGGDALSYRRLIQSLSLALSSIATRSQRR
jgi:hypothetical protein